MSDANKFAGLQSYIQDTVKYFGQDNRVLAWDVWNEPNNSGYADDLLINYMPIVFGWIREVSLSYFACLSGVFITDVIKGVCSVFSVHRCVFLNSSLTTPVVFISNTFLSPIATDKSQPASHYSSLAGHLAAWL